MIPEQVGRPARAGALGGLLGVLGLLLWQALQTFIANAQTWLPYPYPRPGSEGLMLYETLLLRQGGDLYGPITPDSFISGPYPPVYYWLAGRIMPATPGFFDGRSLSMWAAIAAAVCVIGLVGVAALRTGPAGLPAWAGIGVGIGAGLVAAGLWLAAPPVLIWATRFRADMLMIAFMAAGLFCVAAGTTFPASTQRRQAAETIPPNNGPPRLRVSAVNILVWLAIPCFVLALFTKQTALAGPLAAAAYLLVRDWRRGLAWIVGLGLAGGIPFAALDLASGHWFYLKMVNYHSLPWSAGTFWRLLTAWQEDHLLLILVALAYLAWSLLARRNDLIAWYVLATFALLPTAGVVGADHNHLLAVDLALALATAAALTAAGTRLLTGPQHMPTSASRLSKIQNLNYKIAVVVLIAAAIGYLAMVAQPSDWYGADLHMPGAAEQTQIQKILDFIRQAPPGRYFADDPGILALASKATDYDDPFTMTALAAAGRWDASAFEDQLRRGAFPYVFLAGDVSEPPHVPLRADILTPTMRAALRQGYAVLFADVYFTYQPRR